MILYISITKSNEEWNKPNKDNVEQNALIMWYYCHIFRTELISMDKTSLLVHAKESQMLYIHPFQSVTPAAGSLIIVGIDPMLTS